MFGFGVHKYVLSALSGVCICKGQRLKVINILPLLLSFFFLFALNFLRQDLSLKLELSVLID